MPKRNRATSDLETSLSKLCLAHTALAEDGSPLDTAPMAFDLDLPAIQRVDNPKHRDRLKLEKHWQQGSRVEILDRLISLATEWEQGVLVSHFFVPYKERPQQHHFLKEGVVVSIPQCQNLTFRIFTIYQAVETIYNTCMEDTSGLTPELVQLHLVQLRTICTNITPEATTSRRRAPPHERPPLPMTVMWVEQASEVTFAVFGVGKSGRKEDKKIMDMEMERNFRMHTKVD
jgi:hypothetical protein